MTKTLQPDQSRREFLKGGATVALGLGCLGTGLKEALAQARQQGKPLLTERNLNQFFQDTLSSGNGPQRAAEIQSDLKGAIRKYFALTVKQKQQVDSLPDESVKQITDAIGRTVGKNRPLAVSFTPSADGQTQRKTGKQPAPPVKLVEPTGSGAQQISRLQIQNKDCPPKV